MRIFTLVGIFAIVLSGCRGGIEGSSDASFSSSDGTPIESGTVLVVDPNDFVNIDADDDSTGIIATIDFETPAGDVTATTSCFDLTCDDSGCVRDTNDMEAKSVPTVVVEETTYRRVIRFTERPPQKSSCDTVVTSSMFTSKTFDLRLETTCDVNDDFSNPATLDLTQASLARGTGCWNMNFETLSPNDYSIGSLMIDFLAGLGGVYKRISGNDYTVFIDTSSMTYGLDAAVAPGDDNGVGIGFSITESASNMITGAATRAVTVSFEVKEDFALGSRFQCESDIQFDPEGTYAQDTDLDCGGITFTALTGTLTNLPVVGFIKTRSVVTPYYSFDATADNPSGVTKTTFTLLGSSAVDISDFTGGTDAVDIMISVLPRNNVSQAEIVFESFTIEGDGTFVE